MTFYEEDSPFISRKEEKAEKKSASKRDRSKYKKTDKEKRLKRIKQQTIHHLNKKTLCLGRVVAIDPEKISVEYKQDIYACTLRGSLKKEISSIKNLIVIGDFVLFEKEKKSIAHIKERKTILSREEHLRRRQEQLIAANVDQVLITASITAPTLKPSLIDRYIIATQKGGMQPIILINKIDLLKKGSPEEDLLLQIIPLYQMLNIPLICLSTVSKEGLPALEKVMQKRSSVFVGQSGVGKSSLINALTRLSLPTQTLTKKTQKGGHTTTYSRLIALSHGGWCVDTPGIRSFGLWNLKRHDLEIYFPEIQEIAKGCKYSNCTHTHEPSCAVQKALHEKNLSPLRFASFCKLLKEISSSPKSKALR